MSKRNILARAWEEPSLRAGNLFMKHQTFFIDILWQSEKVAEDSSQK